MVGRNMADQKETWEISALKKLKKQKLAWNTRTNLAPDRQKWSLVLRGLVIVVTRTNIHIDQPVM